MCVCVIPVFPCLKARFVEKEMKGFPKIEDLVAMEEVGGDTPYPRRCQQQKQIHPPPTSATLPLRPPISGACPPSPDLMAEIASGSWLVPLR